MGPRTTEKLHDNALHLDARPPRDVAAILAASQVAAASVVEAAIPDICRAASAMATALRSGARLHYVAAGSSGLMAAADAMELGGTFSIPSRQLRIHMAGGLPTGPDMPGETEDDSAGLDAAMAAVSRADVIIAVSASGSTPYTVRAAELAKAQGATIIAIANNPDTPLLALADHPILLATPPEVLAGSTRMGAGTSQKIALNMLSTLMAVELGHIHDGMMVNLRADNTKLRARATGIVQQIANVPAERAASALGAAAGNVKVAALIACGATSDETESLLASTNGHLRPALERLQETRQKQTQGG